LTQRFSLFKVFSELGFSPVAAGIATAVVITAGIVMGRIANAPRKVGFVPRQIPRSSVIPAALPTIPAPPSVIPAAAVPAAPAVPAATTAKEGKEPVSTQAPAGSAALPPYIRYAVPAPTDAKPPFIAIIIDDMGVDMLRTQRILDMPYTMTVSYLAYAPGLQSQISRARDKGKEVLLHVPMESIGANNDYGGTYLSTDAGARENLKRLGGMLAKAEGYIGINNHMGSKFSKDSDLMGSVLLDLKNRGLVFVDSLTTPNTPNAKLAAKFSLPFAKRDVFMDDNPNPADIDAGLAKIEAVARRQGYAVAIGHPREGTIEALSRWLPTLAAKGFTLVPISRVLVK